MSLSVETTQSISKKKIRMSAGTIGTTRGLISQENVDRRYITIANRDASENVSVFASPSGGVGVTVAPGETFETADYDGDLYAAGSGANTAVEIVETFDAPY